jgi:hypothetical protein
MPAGTHGVGRGLLAYVCVIHGIVSQPFTACRAEISRHAGPGFQGRPGQEFLMRDNPRYCRPLLPEGERQWLKKGC